MMKAARLHSIGDLRCDTIERPEPHGKELLIRVAACGICGSDFPRVFAHGTSNGKYPLTIGHEFAWEVVAVGEEADPKLIGKGGAIFPLIPCGQCPACKTAHYAMCEHYDYLGSRRDGGFAEYCLIPSDWHFIPSGSADWETLAMTEPACVAQHAVRKSGVQAGQFLVIYGAGSIGIMAARWARIFGVRPLLTDIVQEKVDFAVSHGMDAVNLQTEDILTAIRNRNGRQLADAAIEGTGASSAFAGCISAVRPLGSIALMGNPMGDTVLPMKIHSMALRKEVSIHGIWNSSRAPYPVDEWAYTIQMMDAGKLIVSDLITTRLTLEELPLAMEQIKSGERKIVKAMVLP